ncbi:MAG: helix-turn-helix domain-containing protein [Tatlockia sp.]|nr:helix-turn-helix domain-containing protein [Tatlockia sp.]
MNHIAKNLKFLIINEGVSESLLSKKIGMPQQVLNRLVSGINLNPKLTTISQIANYFKIPLQDLIYEDLTCIPIKYESMRVPLINFTDLQKNGIEKAISNTNEFVTVDMDTNKQFFATEMYDNSMEPKFPFGSILVFEKNKDPANGDFCLIRTENNDFLFRQILFKAADKKHIKCLNPQFSEYQLVPMPINFYVLATLLESRVSFNFR